jgi:starch phosphorylase
MKPIAKFTVVPKLPPGLEKLRDLAYNLRWAWNHDTIELFRRLDSDLWESSDHNPVAVLGTIDQHRLEEAAADDAFLGHLDRVGRDFDEYMNASTSWFRRRHSRAGAPLIAYFSAEFGITESLSIFAGGLGVLAGDHLKSASDLGAPLVGAGLLYQQGYFRQYLNAAGWQQEAYEDNDFLSLPLTLERSPDGTPLLISVRLAGHEVYAQVWRLNAGRIPLFLLDTNIPANPHAGDRDITDQLYGGDRETRLKQEMILGIGGYRALEALGLEPTVYHMNEGHSAFLALERVRRLMERQGLSFREARELAEASFVFTTHTPVEAGHDYFDPDLMHRYFSEYVQSLGISWNDFMDLGHRLPSPGEDFCMTSLALHLAPFSNAVSKLHGEVSRRMWQSMWPDVPTQEVPIGHVTNGVHFQSWISHDMNHLYDRYLGPKWREEPADQALWRRVQSIPAEELWRTHERRRERLVAFARRRLLEQLRRRGVPDAEAEAAQDVLDSRTLTIGFARRFATYKRATLFLRDRERLARILNHPERPVQIIFAGKAHPRDDAGKALIHEIAALTRQSEFRRHMVFIEDYDMTVARFIVHGADVWLNTPLRPNEACGTSGMKASANGALNLSTLDGWWAEAWNHGEQPPDFIGWAIGRGESYSDREYQDQVEAEALYELLERDVAPTFYERRADGLPRAWINRMKSGIAALCHTYNTHRMVREYTERFYLMAHERYDALAADDAARARSLAAWKERVRAAWPKIRINEVENGVAEEIQVGDQVHVRARVYLGPLSPEEVAVELYLGKVDASGEIVNAAARAMRHLGQEGDVHIFEAAYGPCTRSGLCGYTVRVLPYHRDLTRSLLPGCITWASA